MSGRQPELHPRIEVQIAPRFAEEVDEESLRQAACETLRREGVTGEVELSLVVIDDQYIRQLNRLFRGVDAPTDVLAFGEGEGDFVYAPQATPYLGDVIISYERALAQAREQGHPVEYELKLLAVHGILHLLGYNHADREGRAEMWARQEEILRGWDISQGMRNENLLVSFRRAFSGLWYVIKTQRNALIHLGVASGVVLMGLALSLSWIEWAMVTAIASVFVGLLVFGPHLLALLKRLVGGG